MLLRTILSGLMFSGLVVLPAQAELSPMQQCLLDKLALAADETEVGELRTSCENLQAIKKLDDETDLEAALKRRLMAEEEALENPFEISAYRRNYLLVGSYNHTPNRDIWALDHPEQDINPTEVKFQLSMKALVARGVLGGNLWAGYTQQSWWQLYAADSAPFRETNFEPELFLRWKTDAEFAGFNVRGFAFGYNHESNGRSGDFSRSWNRLMGSMLFDRGNLAVYPRIWWRIPEDADSDDNPDIDDYLGSGDITLTYKYGSSIFTSLLRGNLKSLDKGAVQLDWTFPVGGRFKGYVQYYYGYGESLIDYNHRNHRIGVGILLNDWL